MPTRLAYFYSRTQTLTARDKYGVRLLNVSLVLFPIIKTRPILLNAKPSEVTDEHFALL